MRLFTGIVFLLSLGACGASDVSRGVHDPYEVQNRAIHEENKKLDKALLRPLANGYGQAVPEDVRIGVSNFSSNLSLPGVVVNDLLQLRIGDALHNTARFVVNTTIGLGGVLDPASKGDLELRDTDFGETLHVWGFGQGAYLELPIAGPSTTRDTVGSVVDFAMNPLRGLESDAIDVAVPAATVMSKLGDRYRYGQSVDSVLHESEDSYAQTRLFYLENRDYSLGKDEAPDDDLYDIYEEAYD